jgi:sialic acid synthase SpsE
MISAFGVDLAHKADQYVHCHKIASSEITNVALLETVSDFAKPVFLSTGGASSAKIELALGVLSGVSVVLNYCVGAYPAHGTDLFKLGKLAEYGCPVGFSDHSKDYIYLPRAAVEKHGAVAVEKHLSCIKANTPDSPHSLNPSQFKTMVDILHGRRKTTLNPTAEESDMVLRHQRRLVVTEDVKKGGKIEIGVYRSILPSADGINPFEAATFMDRTAARDLRAGQTLGILDVE